MTLLIVFSGILAYIFIGLVVGKIWGIRSEKKCRNCSSPYGGCRKDHFGAALLAGIFWPIGPLLTLVCLALGQSSDRVANFFTKNL